MTKKQNGPIDFVVLWVDGNDPQWQAKKKAYTPGAHTDDAVARYREWDNLKYWFRAVAKFAPWVRTVHFVSDDQLPPWLNTENPRVHIVSHSDYMPKDALPVFNSCAIGVGLHAIPGLSEQFVLFNDDMFLTAPVTPDYYFRKGLPVDMAGLTRPSRSNEGNVFAGLEHNNCQIVNRHFSKKDILRHFHKWLRPSYGKTFVRTMLHIGKKGMTGFVLPHLSMPFSRSEWEKVWALYWQPLTQTQHHRFRDAGDLSDSLFRYWRILDGKFYPRKSLGKYIPLGEGTLRQAAEYIQEQTFPELCLNDCWVDGDFEQAKKTINGAFEKILPEKCEFER